ncbi:MAG: chromate resistance protein [Betaproteobacteria bacterium]|nr:chromate resistance protein [Betaproteobacteria bacterium]
MFIALMISLPTGNSTLRMRLWRALKETGCSVLRDGVYVLPATAPQAAALAEVESSVRAAGGFAMTAELNVKSVAQIDDVRKLFDRSEEYGVLVGRIGAARTSLRRLGKRKAETLAQRLHQAFEELAAIDFYPGQANLQAKDALETLDRERQRLYTDGEPRAALGTVRRLDPTRFRNRVWVTRKNPWVDRLASAWLIRRFIDPKARFKWIERPKERPKGAVGFDFDGADFTHIGNRVTFEVLLSSFGLEDDLALGQIAAIVHFLDVGGIPIEDAKGLELVLKGMRESGTHDGELALATAGLFDHVYTAYGGGKAVA